MNLYQVIKRPIVTEKAVASGNSRYVFAVDRLATKGSIKAAIESFFKVHVTDVNTSIVRGKIKTVGRNMGKRPNWKKAWVTLKQGEKIEVFEGL